MLRRLFTFLSIISLLLCVVTCVLWVRSYHVAERLAYAHAKNDAFPFELDEALVVLDSGGVMIHHSHWVVTERSAAEDIEWFRGWVGNNGAQTEGYAEGWVLSAQGPSGYPHTSSAPNFTWAGVEYCGPHMYTTSGAPYFGVHVAIPLWLLALLLAAAPVTSAVRWRRARANTRRGLCPACGYDLRASPERCPECGAEALCD